MLTLLGGIAEFEREIMLERQREGIAKAKADSKHLGRKPSARAKGDQVKERHQAGTRATEIAAKPGIGRARTYRGLQGMDSRSGRSLVLGFDAVLPAVIDDPGPVISMAVPPEGGGVLIRSVPAVVPFALYQAT